jgi:hypothetical protein
VKGNKLTVFGARSRDRLVYRKGQGGTVSARFVLSRCCNRT